MKTKIKLATLFATGSLLLASASVPAFAASVMTDAFVANARPNVDFLDVSSRLALDHSGNPRIRAFARSEAREQTITANSMVAWVQTNTRAGAVAALDPTPVAGPLAPVADLATVPLDVASNVTIGVTNGVGDVLTGRSVAIDDPFAVLTPVPRRVAPVGAQLLPAEQNDLARLQALSGKSFDALYRSTQDDALRQLAVLYRDYSRNGDDPALRTLATNELPKINARLSELHRL